MNDTQIKTRYGYILQGALAAALQEAGYEFAQDYQYNETCEIPDFLIPDGDSPRIMIETHQTDARNSFQMKTLRAFTAVTEAKARYGSNLICVNILFGDPSSELPPSNVRAMYGIFDLNIVPRNNAENTDAVISLESIALEFAKDDSLTTLQAIDEVVDKEKTGIIEVASLLRNYLHGAKANRALFPLWRMERARSSSLGIPPVAGNPTYYKRMMLRALYLKDQDFSELVATGNPDLCSSSVQKQLIATGLATIKEKIDGNYLILDSLFNEFIKEPKAPRLRQLCKEVLDETPQMHWFFEDIRDAGRRLQMARFFLESVSSERFAEDLCACLLGDELGNIRHHRCWLVDLGTRALSISQNRLSRLIFTAYENPGQFGDPISHIAPKTARFQGIAPSDKETYAKDIVNALQVIATELAVRLDSITESELSDRLLALRLDGAIKLRKLDPLFLVALGAARRIGLRVEACRVPSILSDLAGVNAVGRFEAFSISDEGSNKVLLANFISAHDHNGDHKSKEWGARRLATIYRIINGKFSFSEYQEAIFVLDGEWTDKDIARLYRCGWNHVVRLDDLEEKLREIFNVRMSELESTPTSMLSSEKDIAIPENKLPLAAEENVFLEKDK